MKALQVMGPRQLARELQASPEIELSADELEDDIRSNPALYYPDYREACRRAGISAFSPSVWADLCVP